MVSSKARQVSHQIRSSRFLIDKKMVGCSPFLTMAKRNISARQKSDPDSPAFQFVALITALMKLPCSHCVVTNEAFCFMVTPCIKNIQHFNIQLTHTTLKNVELLKHFKISKTAPSCFGLQGNHHQGATIST